MTECPYCSKNLTPLYDEAKVDEYSDHLEIEVTYACFNCSKYFTETQHYTLAYNGNEIEEEDM